MKECDMKKVEEAVRNILEAIGEDPEREGLKDTPKRVARFYQEVFAGLKEEPGDYLNVQFTENHEEMIIVKDIPIYSMCEHHLLPFFGLVHVAYIPKDGKITGLSKLARVAEGYARRPQLQERLTSQIANSMEKILTAWGVLVVIEAEHMCMTIRGIKKPGSRTVTSAVRGIFKSNAATRAEAFSLILSG
ncbi:GTP cyclohydrolase I FolE [Desulfosporosinus lacus]|uniref:GTP cyclohydrolase 1 n=1 Tax=Desulfosporosinus lacus DSM 15449 TaxID=1121420 RepID=A0A1M5V3S0_9FIRM|nr:GTP cyclohydrolase I FolE [Desulfosporosinus lacus]SHH69902.1 GTP cyclohydrolase I [Desulfosporosinus lacus DSM 15449]